MESKPADAKLGEGSSQVDVHAVEPLNEEAGLGPTEKRTMKNEDGGSFGHDCGFRRIYNYVPESATSPSFSRTARPSTSHNLAGAKITRQSVSGQNVVVVRQRTSAGQTNPTDHSSLVPMEDDEKIAEEEAICKFCFEMLKEENILKMECRCGKALLTHEECAANWSRLKGNNNCDSCEQEVKNFPVTLLRGLSSARRVDNQESNKPSLFSWLTRIWS